MSAAVEIIAISENGGQKKDFEASLQHISDQVRWMDQKLTMKVDNEIWQSFQNQQNEINYTQSIIKRVQRDK